MVEGYVNERARVVAQGWSAYLGLGSVSSILSKQTMKKPKEVWGKV